jgi:hypothetical protein
MDHDRGLGADGNPGTDELERLAVDDRNRVAVSDVEVFLLGIGRQGD